MSREPLVSVCIPTFNRARWIREAVESALAQTYEHLEVLVVDDASADGTESVVRAFGDPRVRFLANERNLGMLENHNRTLRLARGPLIKFLHADDVLAPECVERMVECALRSERVGLVFAPRRVELDGPAQPEDLAWVAQYGTLHEPLGPLEPVNAGRPLFERWLRGILRERGTENWVGEPSAVLLRRTALERVGLFNERLSMLLEVELWLRIVFFFDVGFVDEELSTYRHHASSATSALAESGRSWLDRLWMLEGLLAHPEIRRAHPELRRARAVEAVWAARLLAGRAARRRPLDLGSLAAYASFLARRRPALHPRLG